MFKVKPVLFKLISLVLAFVTMFLLAEILLRLSKPFTRIYHPAGKSFEAIYIPDDDYVYGLKPNTVYKHYSYYGDFVATYRINSQGLRSNRDYEYKKPEGVKRVLILGDSYAFGRGVDNDQTCAAILEKRLNETGQRFEVLNSGVLGYSTDNEFLYLKKRGVLFSPDIVILMMFPCNDIMDMARHKWEIDEKGLPWKISDNYYAVDNFHHLVEISNGKKNFFTTRFKEFMRDNSYVYTFFSEYRYYLKYEWTWSKSFFAEKKGSRKTKLFNINDAGIEEKQMIKNAQLLLEGMKDITDKKGTKFIVAVIPGSSYDNIMLDFLKSKGIDVIDIGYNMKLENIKNVYLPKDMHWSKSGNSYVAGLVYNRLKNEKP